MDHATARTAIYDFGKDQFRGACLAVLGADVVPELRYGGVPEDEPAHDRYWARVSRRVTSEVQETLRNGAQQRRFCTTGITFVQLFGPIGDSLALTNVDQIAELVRNAFRLCQGEELEFTNAAISDTITPEPNWIGATVRADYKYRQFIS